jgi:hypothetical protein
MATLRDPGWMTSAGDLDGVIPARRSGDGADRLMGSGSSGPKPNNISENRLTSENISVLLSLRYKIDNI